MLTAYGVGVLGLETARLAPASLASAGQPTLTWAEFADWSKGEPLRILFTIVFAIALRWFVARLIDRMVEVSTHKSSDRLSALPRKPSEAISEALGANDDRHVQRMRTLGAILKSVSTMTIFTVATLMVLALLGLPLGPLLASAGVGGVALGFGAQSLVKDFLSGIFMIMEDQYGVGDIIDAGEAVGTVEDVTLRVTRLRDSNGVIWYVRNGEIIRVGNKSQGYAMAVIDVPVAYSENIDRVMATIKEVLAAMSDSPEWDGKLLEEPVAAGVESVTAGAVTVRVLAKCAPDEQFGVARAVRRELKEAFDAKGIKGPTLPAVFPAAGGTAGSAAHPTPPSTSPTP